MEIIKDINEWQRIRKQFSHEHKVGFVPTMGCLHQGHVSLLNQSVEQNDITVASIFVNPTQFNDPADFQNYPKKHDEDCEILRQAKVDYVIMPDVEGIYPEKNHLRLTTDHPDFSILEGSFRPGHFDGVLTVVMKLLMIVNSHRTYFGEKDFQQYSLIKKLIKNYFIPTEIILCPTIRESSGLPLSSRNTRLNSDDKHILEKFYKRLFEKKNFDVNYIKELCRESKIPYDYIEILDNRLFIALRIGAIRVIDNMALTN